MRLFQISLESVIFYLVLQFRRDLFHRVLLLNTTEFAVKGFG